MHLGRWNILEGLKNKREIIIKDLKELKLDIITLTETKKDSGLDMIGGFINFYSEVSKQKQAKRGLPLKEKTL
jgi:hypothetical protein